MKTLKIISNSEEPKYMLELTKEEQKTFTSNDSVGVIKLLGEMIVRFEELDNS